jgi:hypothetical protein
MRNPPILISVLGFFALIAGITWLVVGLRILGFDWFGLFGDLPKFEQTGLWGWLALAGGIAWIAAGVGLWSLQSWAWLFAMIMCGLGLFEAFLWMIEYPGSGIGLTNAILPLVLIWYLNTDEVRKEFGTSKQA